MAYATIADLIEEASTELLLELADDLDSGDINDAAVQALLQDNLDDAAAMLDSYVGVVYALPLASTPDVLNKYNSLYALYLLYLRRGQVPDALQLAIDNLLRWLRDLAAGKVQLGLPAADVPVPLSLPRAVVAGPQIFTRTSLRNL